MKSYNADRSLFFHNFPLISIQRHKLPFSLDLYNENQ